jgi:hypothetical protein
MQLILFSSCRSYSSKTDKCSELENISFLLNEKYDFKQKFIIDEHLFFFDSVNESQVFLSYIESSVSSNYTANAIVILSIEHKLEIIDTNNIEKLLDVYNVNKENLYKNKEVVKILHLLNQKIYLKKPIKFYLFLNDLIIFDENCQNLDSIIVNQNIIEPHWEDYSIEEKKYYKNYKNALNEFYLYNNEYFNNLLSMQKGFYCDTLGRYLENENSKLYFLQNSTSFYYMHNNNKTIKVERVL